MMRDFLRKHIEKIVSLTDEEFELAAVYFAEKKLRKRQYLIQEEQEVSHIYLVEKGLVKSSYFADDGKEHIIQFACENWWVSDFQAFYKEEKAILAVDCLENCELISVSRDGLDELCQKLPKMERFFRVKTSLGYVALQSRLLSMLNKSAKERYEDFISQYPEMMQRIPRQTIAAYLGVSRETLSRLYKKT